MALALAGGCRSHDADRERHPLIRQAARALVPRHFGCRILVRGTGDSLSDRLFGGFSGHGVCICPFDLEALVLQCGASAREPVLVPQQARSDGKRY
jgi:hypothetical protein